MPFVSENQRRFMWANHPDIAEKWAHGQHSTKRGPHKMPRSSSRAKRKSRRGNRTGRK